MKRKYCKIIIVLMLVCSLFFVGGCNLSDYFNSNDNDNDNVYKLNAVDIADYTSIDADDIGVTVSSVIIPATVEIECKIDYSYYRTVMGPGWGSSRQKVESSATSLATGFFINEDGYLLTNAHVVTLEDYEGYDEFTYEDRQISVNYADSSQTFSATIVAYDVDLDLAILHVDVTNIEGFKYVTFYNLTDPESSNYNDEDAVKLLYGEVALAIGNANGYGISVTQGIVSAPIRYFQNNGVTVQAIQTDAAINSGNSGGPLVNKFCSVIGINSFKIVTETSESLGYAIPSNVVLKYIDTVNEQDDMSIKYYYTNNRVFSNEGVSCNIK